MKTFRLIGAALLAVLMCANFASCSKDEEKEEEDVPQYELVTDGKKLKKIEFTLSDHDSDFIEVWDFSYDSEGKLIEATFTDSYENKTYHESNLSFSSFSFAYASSIEILNLSAF